MMKGITHFLNKFKYAGQGIRYAVMNEISLKIHLLMASCAVGLGIYLRLPLWKWALLLLIIAMVMVAEMLNTAIEIAVDLYSRQYNTMAKRAKDVAAGAVLLSAFAALLLAVVIFVL